MRVMWKILQFNFPLLPVVLLLVLSGCGSSTPTTDYVVTLVVDGREIVYQVDELMTVDQFLREAEIDLQSLDRTNPEGWTQIYDTIRITVVRVRQEEYCEDVEVAFRQQTQLDERLNPGEEYVGQAGRPGLERVCYRVLIENNQPTEPVEVSRVMTTPPVNEVIFVGPRAELEPIPIDGTLAYLSGINGMNNAWIIRGNTNRKRLLTYSNDLDGRVFALSSDGRQLLFTRASDAESTFNQLWLIPDTVGNTPEALPLLPRDVLTADWVPGRQNTISYSSAEQQDAAPGWRAYNDLWLTTIDPATGEQIRNQEILQRSSGGIYGWWGTGFDWSPDGSKLAWIRADGIGLVDLEEGQLDDPLVSYTELNTSLGNWSWRTTVDWSDDSALIATTVHGPPSGDERPENSPVFNVAVVATDGSFATELVARAGIWSAPRFSPTTSAAGEEFPKGYIAYLQARNWETSINGSYDLVIADRDGSNARVIFPPAGQPGLTAEQFAQNFTWDPFGRRLAIIYQGNLWIIDAQDGSAFQVTQDGGVSAVDWTS